MWSVLICRLWSTSWWYWKPSIKISTPIIVVYEAIYIKEMYGYVQRKFFEVVIDCDGDGDGDGYWLA